MRSDRLNLSSLSGCQLLYPITPNLRVRALGRALVSTPRAEFTLLMLLPGRFILSRLALVRSFSEMIISLF